MLRVGIFRRDVLIFGTLHEIYLSFRRLNPAETFRRLILQHHFTRAWAGNFAMASLFSIHTTYLKLSNLVKSIDSSMFSLISEAK